jgi:hypothetical protein
MGFSPLRVTDVSGPHEPGTTARFSDPLLIPGNHIGMGIADNAGVGPANSIRHPHMASGQWQQNLSVCIVDGKGNCIFANNDIMAGEMIGYFEGHEILYYTKYSIFLEDRIIEGAGILRNLAHSCDPNASFKDDKRWLYALRDIQKGAEITIDYERTEPVISHPFVCRCGSPNCRRVIDGSSRGRRQI